MTESVERVLEPYTRTDLVGIPRGVHLRLLLVPEGLEVRGLRDVVDTEWPHVSRVEAGVVDIGWAKVEPHEPVFDPSLHTVPTEVVGRAPREYDVREWGGWRPLFEHLSATEPRPIRLGLVGINSEREVRVAVLEDVLFCEPFEARDEIETRIAWTWGTMYAQIS